VERGISAPGWFANGRCYHPSFPPRSLKMVEDFVDYRGTVITWPSLGGGGISLSYLEHEAYDSQPPRMRQYGFLNDSEFLAECHSHGVKAFSVIFCMQGWEFPAEFNDAEDQVLSMNELRGVGKRGYLGLREFTQNRYPKIWDPFEKYFPDGLYNSRGEVVTDLFEECCSRDIHGNAIHADWLEVPDREHSCHFMNINNPVWREYLKAIVGIQIDAGVDGVQFDEPDSPFGALSYGGDFSYDVLQPFKEYLQQLSAELIPESVRLTLDDFHYGEWLLSRGRERVDFTTGGDEGWLAKQYATFLRGRQGTNFHELASYVRDYAATKGRTVLVSANLFDGAIWHESLVADVDLLVPEQRYTLFEQPAWMRYIAAFAGDKPVCINPNPYDGVLPDLVPRMKLGRSMDRYRVMLYEAAALGVNMSVSYGSWMGNKIHDAMWSPYDETVEVQGFLADHESLFSCGRRSMNSTAVVFSVASNFFEMASEFYFAEKIPGDEGEKGPHATPFQQAAHAIGISGRPFDVVMFHDGIHSDDDVSLTALARYERVVMPNVHSLTEKQLDATLGYLHRGGLVTLTGQFGADRGAKELSIINHPNTMHVTALEATALIPGPAQVVCEGAARVASNIQYISEGSGALHIVNYDYDEDADSTRAIYDLAIAVRVPFEVRRAIIHTPGKESYAMDVIGGRLTVGQLNCYAIIELSSE